MKKNIESIILDIDGVLCDNTELQKLYNKETRTFDYEKADIITPHLKVNEWAKELCNSLYTTRSAKTKNDIILLTGRSNSIREVTETWLAYNDIRYDTLVTKPSKNLDDVPYKILYHDFFTKLYGKKPLFTVEDNPSIVNALRGEGYNVLQPNHLFK